MSQQNGPVSRGRFALGRRRNCDARLSRFVKKKSPFVNIEFTNPEIVSDQHRIDNKEAL